LEAVVQVDRPTHQVQVVREPLYKKKHVAVMIAVTTEQLAAMVIPTVIPIRQIVDVVVETVIQEILVMLVDSTIHAQQTVNNVVQMSQQLVDKEAEG
jgi:hypothetical protein